MQGVTVGTCVASWHMGSSALHRQGQGPALLSSGNSWSQDQDVRGESRWGSSARRPRAAQKEGREALSSYSFIGKSLSMGLKNLSLLDKGSLGQRGPNWRKEESLGKLADGSHQAVWATTSRDTDRMLWGEFRGGSKCLRFMFDLTFMWSLTSSVMGSENQRLHAFKHEHQCLLTIPCQCFYSKWLNSHVVSFIMSVLACFCLFYVNWSLYSLVPFILA